jgi:hypothetical protein
MNEILGFQVSYYDTDDTRLYYVVTLWEPMRDLYPNTAADVTPTVDDHFFLRPCDAQEWAKKVYADETAYQAQK